MLTKYHIIAEEIIAAIKAGELLPGTKVMSENEIIARYRVSNTTARKSLQLAESQGYVRKVKGKGTFVRQPGVYRSINRILSFTQNMREAGRTPSTKVLDVRTVHDSQCLHLNGRNYTLRGPLCKIHRLRFADGVPMMIEVRYISLALCPDIDQEDFSGSLYDIFAKKYHRHLTEAKQQLRTEMMDAGTLNFFDLASPIPALVVEGVTFCGGETILEMERSLYRGDKYRFTVSAV